MFMNESDLTAGPDETLDPLSRKLWILQHKRGHRATSDDVLLAGFGVQAAPNAKRLLDLGSGKGTVALYCLSVLPELSAIGLEAVESAHLLAKRNARLNHLENRYDPRFADLRDDTILQGELDFDLILGAPPFMPMGTGVLPANEERAAGRFEIRGGIESYVACVAIHLSEAGRAVLLMDGHGAERGKSAILNANLSLIEQISILPRPGEPATFTVYICARHSNEPTTNRVFTMRNASGDAWSSEYQALRDQLDLP